MFDCRSGCKGGLGKKKKLTIIFANLFQFPDKSSSRMEEINIAVLGSPQVGKSTFIQRSFDLRALPDSPFTSRKMSIDGNVYVVRLVELAYDDLDLDEHKRICWPDTIAGNPVPVIDGAFTLYDVLNRDSLGEIPDALGKWLACPTWHNIARPVRRIKALLQAESTMHRSHLSSWLANATFHQPEDWSTRWALSNEPKRSSATSPHSKPHKPSRTAKNDVWRCCSVPLCQCETVSSICFCSGGDGAHAMQSNPPLITLPSHF